MNEQEPNQPSQQPPVSDATSQAEAWPTTASAAPAKSSNVARWWVGAAIAVVLITVGAVGVMFYKNASLSERQIPDAQVTIEKGAFTPTTIKVQKGQAVTWHNKDETNHRLTAEQDSIKSFNTAD
jgi:plastocyanin